MHQPAMQPDSAHGGHSATPRVRLGDALVARDLITREQLEGALNHQATKGHKKLLGEVLVELNFVTEETVMEVLAHGYGLPFVTETTKIADPKVVELLPRDFLEEHHVLPLFRVRGVLTVAVSEPANLFLVEEIERLTGDEVQIVAASKAEIASSLQAYLPAANVFVVDDIYEDIDDADFSVIEKEVADLADLQEVAGRKGGRCRGRVR